LTTLKRQRAEGDAESIEEGKSKTAPSKPKGAAPG